MNVVISSILSPRPETPARAPLRLVVDTTGHDVTEAPMPPSTLGQRLSTLGPAAAKLNERLEQIVSRGKQATAPTLRRIIAEQPVDRIVRAQALTFGAPGDGRVTVGFADHETTAHPHAFAQIVQRAGVGFAYADGLRQGASWRPELLQHILSEHYRHDRACYLMREVAGTTRGFLSDRYKRLDSRPLLESFGEACTAMGLELYEGVASDVRTAVRAIRPVAFEPVSGEALAFGLSWSNSDYGAGVYSIMLFTLRLRCLNGMTSVSDDDEVLRRVHLGRKLSADVELSAATLAHETRAMASATRDVVRSLMSPAALDRRCRVIRDAASREVSFSAALRQARNVLSKKDTERAQAMFEGDDVVMLPPGRTMWRASNVFSWLANETDDADRKLALQAAAGAIVAAV